MYNDFIENLEFSTGFKMNMKISIFDDEYSVPLKFKAFYEQDGITSEQKESFAKLKADISIIIGQVESGLLGKFENAKERFTLTMILIRRQGELAFLFDDKEDEDDGVAVQVFPTYLIESQDNYL